MNKIESKINELYNKFLFEQDENTKFEYGIMLLGLTGIFEFNNNISDNVNNFIKENLEQYTKYCKLRSVGHFKQRNLFENFYLDNLKMQKMLYGLKDLILDLENSVDTSSNFIFNTKDFYMIYEFIKNDSSRFSNFIRNELKNIIYTEKDYTTKAYVNKFNKDRFYIIENNIINYNSISLHEITHGYNDVYDNDASENINNEIPPILVQHSFEEFTYPDLSILKAHIDSYKNLVYGSTNLDNCCDYRYSTGLLFSIAFNYKYGHNIKTVSKAVDKLITYYDKSFEFLMNDFNISEDDLKNSIKEYTKKIRRD